MRNQLFFEVAESEGGVAPVHHRRAAVAIVAALVVVAVPLTLISFRINSTRTTEDEVSTVASSWATAQGWTITSSPNSLTAY